MRSYPSPCWPKVCCANIFKCDCLAPYSHRPSNMRPHRKLNGGLQELVLFHEENGCAPTGKRSANFCQRFIAPRSVKKDHEVTRVDKGRSAGPAVSCSRTASRASGLKRSGLGSAPRKSEPRSGPSKCTARRSAAPALASRHALLLRFPSATPKHRLPTTVSVNTVLFDVLL
jgi:hypothetical protein